LPLIDVQEMIDSVNWTKEPSRAEDLRSGIIGWPPARTTRTSRPLFRPAIIPDWQGFHLATGSAARACGTTCPSAGSRQMSADGNIYKAYGGLRLKRFIDSFGNRGKRSASVTRFHECDGPGSGWRLARGFDVRLHRCPLIDTDPNTPKSSTTAKFTTRVLALPWEWATASNRLGSETPL